MRGKISSRARYFSGSMPFLALFRRSDGRKNFVRPYIGLKKVPSVQFRVPVLAIRSHASASVSKKMPRNDAITKIFFYLCFWSYPTRNILKKRYAYLVDENLRNFQMSKDSIVALTLWRGLLLLHLLIRFSQDLHLRRGICGTTLLVGKQPPEEPPARQNDNTP